MNLNFYASLLLVVSSFSTQAQPLAINTKYVEHKLPDPTRVEAKVARAIQVSEINKNIGKQISFCGKVYLAKPVFTEMDKLVQLKVGTQFINERIDITVRFDADAPIQPGIEHVLLEKNICFTGKVIDAFGTPEVYIDQKAANRLVAEAAEAVPEADTAMVDGQDLKLLSPAYLLEGPKWKHAVITHLKAGAIVKAEKVQKGWLLVTVLENDGDDVEDQKIQGYITYQALGLNRNCKSVAGTKSRKR